MADIIAEIGSNWETKEHCLESIQIAKKAGATAVKFQLYTKMELQGTAGTLSGELPRDWVQTLKAECVAVGIEFMCTAFSLDGLAFIDPYVDRHKIASAECLWPDFRKAVLATGKPLLISLGGCSLKEMDDLKLWLPNDRTTLLYCAGAYPARYIDLSMLAYLRNKNGTALGTWEVGYSDHSNTVTGIADQAIITYGASVLEKHVTAFPDLDTPDRPHSITMRELYRLIQAIKNKTIAHPTPEERDMVQTWRRTAQRGWKRG